MKAGYFLTSCTVSDVGFNGSHISGYKGYCLLNCDAMQFGRQTSMFQKNMLHLRQCLSYLAALPKDNDFCCQLLYKNHGVSYCIQLYYNSWSQGLHWNWRNWSTVWQISYLTNLPMIFTCNQVLLNQTSLLLSTSGMPSRLAQWN